MRAYPVIRGTRTPGDRYISGMAVPGSVTEVSSFSVGDLRWADVAKEFTPQAGEYTGALRDLVISGVDLQGWDLAYQYLRDHYQHRFTVESFLPPPTAAELFDKRDVPPLVVDVGGVQVFCWFYLVDRIELSFDPREVTDEVVFSEVLGLLTGLGKAVGERAAIIYEEAPQAPVLEYDPVADRLEYFPSE